MYQLTFSLVVISGGWYACTLLHIADVTFVPFPLVQDSHVAIVQCGSTNPWIKPLDYLFQQSAANKKRKNKRWLNEADKGHL